LVGSRRVSRFWWKQENTSILVQPSATALQAPPLQLVFSATPHAPEGFGHTQSANRWQNDSWKQDLSILFSQNPGKHIHWHADWLLDRLEVEITGVVAIRCPLHLEEPLSEALGLHPGARPLAPRLGAQDARSGTHLLRLTDPPSVERMLTKRITALSDLLPVVFPAILST